MKKSKIKMLVLSLTGQCNFACRYCYAEQHPQQTMDFRTAVKAVDLAAASVKPFVLQFSGGEPLLAFPVLRDIVLYVRQHKLPAIMQLQTNASLLTPEKVAFLRDAKVGIGISLDGRPELNDKLRQLPDGSGTCRQILAGASQLAAHGVEIGITCVVTSENVDQLAGIVEMAYYLGNVRRIGFDLLRAQGRGGLLTAPSAQTLARGLAAALETAWLLEQRTGKSLLISQLERVELLSRGALNGFAHCHSLNGEAAFVDAQGNIYACSSFVGDETFRLGHVDTGIDEQRQQAIRTLIQTSMSFCNDCQLFQLCGGGCFARWHGAGCTNQAYEVECSLKKVSIDWYQKKHFI